MKIREGLTYDDVLLVPKHSTIKSRSDVDISTSIGEVPIISANMDSITEEHMALAMWEAGGMGILHRFMSIERTNEAINFLRDNNAPAHISVGINEKELNERLAALVKSPIFSICIDVAHGHHDRVWNSIQKVKEAFPGRFIIAGNVATAAGAHFLYRAGAHAIKVGIGPGSLCTTRIVTGCGVPQLTALDDIVKSFNPYKDSVHKGVKPPKRPQIYADGGIKNSGDIVKALAVGADAVMIGSLFAGTHEAAMRTEYRGMASKAAQVDWKGSATHVEGVSKYVPPRGSVKDIIEKLVSGIKSGFSYVGAHNIAELRENAEFIRITHSGLMENNPHGI